MIKRIKCKYPRGPHKEWQSHYSYPGTKLIGQSLPYCGCMSNAGLWLLQVLRTEASSSCQLRNKYQIAWWRGLEKRTSQQSANCHRADALLKLRVATARGLIQDNPTRRVFGLLALLHVLLTINFLSKPLRRKHFHFHVLPRVCLLCRMQRLKQF